MEVLIENHRENVYMGYSNQYHMVHIYSSKNLSGRIKVRWNEIKDNIYIVKEGSICD